MTKRLATMCFMAMFLVGVMAAALVAQESPTSQASTAALTNKDIVTMVNAGLSQEIVLAKIKSSTCEFDTSPDKLTELKKAGVLDPVILAMIEAPRRQTKTVYEAIASPVRAAPLRMGRIICTIVSSIPMFASPNPGSISTPIAQPKCGDKISILDEQAAWDKVQTEDGKVGYVASLFVSKGEGYSSQQTTWSASRVESGSASPGTLRAIAWRAVPWVTTSYYQQPGNASTDCTGSGTWFGSIYQGNTSCTTQYTPAQQVPINWTHFTIYNQVETEDSMLVIACTRNWAFSKCVYLVPGDVFSFARKGGKISVTGQRGKNKTQDLDFDIVSSQPKASR